MHCAAERLVASDAVLGQAAREAAAARSPGCRFDEAWHWAAPSCTRAGPAPAADRGRAPVRRRPRDRRAALRGGPALPARRRGGRAIVVARFAQATGCAAADTSVTEHRSHLLNGGFVTALRVAGCKESTYYECQRGPAPDGPPVCR